MFDTIHVRKPLVCPVCGAEVCELQTHHFGETMAHLKIGSVLSASPVLTGIVRETLWCRACHKAGQPSSDSPVYLVVWHSLLAAVEQDVAKAEASLAAVDRLDLIGWLDESQREAARWRRHYHALFTDVSRWHEHLNSPPESGPADATAERRRAFRRLFSLPDEILAAPDPLAAILAANKHADGEADD